MKKTSIRWLTNALVFFGSGGLFAFIAIVVLVRAQEDVRVPDLRGRTVTEAKEVLTSLRLKSLIDGSQFSDVVPQGAILTQSIAPNERVRLSRTVVLRVSNGPRNRMVPKLTGLTKKAATSVLVSSQLRPRWNAVTCSDQMTVEHVLAQYPNAGEGSLDGEVQLLASAGPCRSKYVVQSMDGKSERAVSEEIEKAAFPFITVRRTFDPHASMAIVKRTSPGSGSIASRSEHFSMDVHGPESTDARVSRKTKGAWRLLAYRGDPGFFRRRGSLILRRGGGVWDQTRSFLLRPGEALFTLVWLPSGGQAVVKFQGKAAFRVESTSNLISGRYVLINQDRFTLGLR